MMTGIILSISCMKTIINPGMDEPAVSSIDPALHTTDSDSIQKDSLLPQKYIYLTIDDAPFNGSEYIDSVIFSAKIKTSIFIVGSPINGSHKFERYHKMLKKNPYIELYNHSYSHANHKYANYYKNPEQVVDDFEKNRSEFNLFTQIARLPGRNLWQVCDRKKNYQQTGAEAAALLAEKGYKIFGWDIEWKYDLENYSPLQTIDELIEEIDSSYHTSNTFTPNHVVLLMHDQMFTKRNTENDLGKLIDKLKSAGYTFEYLRSYPDMAEQ